MPADMKGLIAQAFKNLAKQKSIDKITVKALIEACGNSRQTFYYHFQDIMDVISWTLQQAARETLEQGIKADTPQEAFRILICDILENRSLVIRLLDSQRRAEIEALFLQTAKISLIEMLRRRPLSRPLPYTDMDMALDFWAYGITGLLLSRCLKGSVDPDQLAVQIVSLVPNPPASSDSQTPYNFFPLS